MNFGEKMEQNMSTNSQNSTPSSSGVSTLALQSPVSMPPLLSSPTSTSPNSGVSSYVRKCLGKNKQVECLQLGEHPNTRWECNYFTDSRDEFTKHVKNIYKRVKWRTLVDDTKPDSSGLLRCVYFSTDKHHVENHYSKAMTDVTSPGPSGVQRGSRRYNQTYNPNIIVDVASQYGKRKGFGEEFEENYDDAANKKMTFDPTDMEYREQFQYPDTTKTKELLDNLQKKLELPLEMCNSALEKLHNNGYFTLLGLRSLKPENWVRLDLPMAIEDELRKISAPKPSFESNGTPNSNGSVVRNEPHRSGSLPLPVMSPSQTPEDSDSQHSPIATPKPGIITPTYAPTVPGSNVHYVGFHPWGATPQNQFYFSFPHTVSFPPDMHPFVQEENGEAHPQPPNPNVNVEIPEQQSQDTKPSVILLPKHS